jgi:hypothetical protein
MWESKYFEKGASCSPVVALLEEGGSSFLWHPPARDGTAETQGAKMFQQERKKK